MAKAGDAYRELAGVVTKRRTTGTYVSEGGSPLARRERMRILAVRVDALLSEAHQLDINNDEVLAMVRRRNERFEPRSKET